ncbi:MAG: helix-turn-helix transcriptional regulator [Bacteroidetes bacterium]|nr:helix-turn-helix transcriptional regulator [Bacteroidota bacterium]
MVKELLTYISRHLDEDITLEALARHTGYSPFHLHRKIKDELGEPVGDFIKKQRIQTAADLLSLTDLPAGEIKYLVGYSNDSSFSKAFKSVMEISPRQFRSEGKFRGKLSSLPGSYLSLNCEVRNLHTQEAIIFPSIGDYFSKSVYNVWKDVKEFIEHEKLNEEDFDFYAVLHACQNVTPGPGRYDAAIVPKKPNKLNASKFFRTYLPGGKYARYKFCCKVDQYRENTLLINKHLVEEACLKHSTGVSYFKFQALPNYQNPDNTLIEWMIPIK